MSAGPDYQRTRIADPIHGTIGLSELEAKIVGTRAFQRLRNVKQLGLAHFVFPAANYNRFSHSIGTCHVAGRVLSSLQRRYGEEKIPHEAVVKYRLAALLHDAGHYPFSHTMEDALKAYYVGGLAAPAGGEAGAAPEVTDPYINHEAVGKRIFTKDPAISQLLGDAGMDPLEIASIVGGELIEGDPLQTLQKLVSSDLDVDRLDYLSRTSHHTGLPYGSVDLPYVIDHMRVHDEVGLCITEKAVRTVSHMLLCRYFDYRQVSYHKTVKAFEYILEDVIGILLERGLLKADRATVEGRIADGSWWRFDDGFVMEAIRTLEEDDDPVVRLKAESLSHRRPPKLVAEFEVLEDRLGQGWQAFDNAETMMSAKLKGLAEAFGLDPRLVKLWKPAKMVVLTKYPPGALDEEHLAKSVYVLHGDGVTTDPLPRVHYSLMGKLSDYALNLLRVYVLPPPDAPPDLREKMAHWIRENVAGSWKPANAPA